MDDFTPNNGATRVIPGSHLVLRPVPKALLQPERRHPDEKLIVAKAGSVLLFNAHLLHSGTRNRSNGSRRALQCQFRARAILSRPTRSSTCLRGCRRPRAIFWVKAAMSLKASTHSRPP